MQSMKGATSLLGSMNRSMNLPALQRIAMEFERENDIMDQRQEMMDESVDDMMGVDEEEEGELVVQEVLDELKIDLGSQLGETPAGLQSNGQEPVRVAQAIGGPAGSGPSGGIGGGTSGGGGGGGGVQGNDADGDLEARLRNLRD